MQQARLGITLQQVMSVQAPHYNIFYKVSLLRPFSRCKTFSTFVILAIVSAVLLCLVAIGIVKIFQKLMAYILNKVCRIDFQTPLL